MNVERSLREKMTEDSPTLLLKMNGCSSPVGLRPGTHRHIGREAGLGSRDEGLAVRPAEAGRLLLDHGLSPDHEVGDAFPIFPAFLRASSGGNIPARKPTADRTQHPASSESKRTAWYGP